VPGFGAFTPSAALSAVFPVPLTRHAGLGKPGNCQLLMRDQSAPMAPASDNRALDAGEASPSNCPTDLASSRRTLPSPRQRRLVSNRKPKSMETQSLVKHHRTEGRHPRAKPRWMKVRNSKEQERSLTGSANVQRYPRGSHPCALPPLSLLSARAEPYVLSFSLLVDASSVFRSAAGARTSLVLGRMKIHRTASSFFFLAKVSRSRHHYRPPRTGPPNISA
jgi:hypothetical protein